MGLLFLGFLVFSQVQGLELAVEAAALHADPGRRQRAVPVVFRKLPGQVLPLEQIARFPQGRAPIRILVRRRPAQLREEILRQIVGVNRVPFRDWRMATSTSITRILGFTRPLSPGGSTVFYGNNEAT
jgi:hypothetical protein